MEMPDDKLFFAPIWRITEKLYENINKRQISPTTHLRSAGKITSGAFGSSRILPARVRQLLLRSIKQKGNVDGRRIQERCN
jgi:hypothetical protein